jgi:PHP-associated
VRRLRAASWLTLAAALACGSIADVAPVRSPLVLGGYRVLAADLHVHTWPFSAATLAPWDVVMEARRQGLDAIAITAHNQVVSGKIGRWFSGLIGGPTVLVGEEVHTAHYHLIAAGIDHTISWRLKARDAVRETHRQGGVAIAAHPTRDFAAGWEGAAGELDGAEVLQPTSWTSERAAEDMREFYRSFSVAAIASSDYHGFAPLGDCRTYVFARDNSEAGILEAIRAHRTLVFDGDRVYGDAECARLAAGRLPEKTPEAGPLSRASGILGLAGLLGVICSGWRQ